MGVSSALNTDMLSSTLNPELLRSMVVEVGRDRPCAVTMRPHSAVPSMSHMGSGKGMSSNSHSQSPMDRLLPPLAQQAAAERRRGELKGEAGKTPAKIDKTAMQNIRDDLIGSLPDRKDAGIRARLHDSPSRSPVAERRFPLRGGGGERDRAGSAGEGGTEVRGLVGLQNLGNTCFINTCVQCLSNVAPFGNFFLHNHHMHKLNKSSSMKGTLVLSFGQLLHKVYHSAAYSSVSAATLRERVGKFAPQFTGFRQHDCQVSNSVCACLRTYVFVSVSVSVSVFVSMGSKCFERALLVLLHIYVHAHMLTYVFAFTYGRAGAHGLACTCACMCGCVYIQELLRFLLDGLHEDMRCSGCSLIGLFSCGCWSLFMYM